MMRNTPLFLLTALAIACSTPEQRPDSQTVEMKDRTVDEIAEEERPPERPRRTERPEAVDEEESELALEMFEVRAEAPAVTDDGIEIHMRSGTPNWEFELVRGGETVTARHTGTDLYIEGVAFGGLFEFTGSGEAVQVTLRSDAPAHPLSPEAALRIAREERESRLGCDGTSEVTAVQPNGTVMLRVLTEDGSEACNIVVGRYTGRVVDL